MLKILRRLKKTKQVHFSNPEILYIFQGLQDLKKSEHYRNNKNLQDLIDKIIESQKDNEGF
jgi:hypothetical protein